jgi:hypothetical protein
MWDRCARVAGGKIVHFYRGGRLPFYIIGIGVVAMRMRGPGLSRGDVHAAALADARIVNVRGRSVPNLAKGPVLQALREYRTATAIGRP